ncbi:hypothetical protein ACFV7Q_09685 [Streptomyces sp. NPDC059851]|uniref:hypothetical protein n=1 Tax=Streptomyces sp. NPDC059851 TaxID=3346971 RepID=UPI00365C5A01
MTGTTRTFLTTGVLGALLLVAAVAEGSVGHSQDAVRNAVIAGDRLAGGKGTPASALPTIDWP